MVEAASDAHHPLPPPQPRRGIAAAACLSTVLENLYRGRLTWQAVRMRKLLGALESPAPEAAETLRHELLGLLGEEIAGARQEWERAEKRNREDAALERDACLGPVGSTWEMLLREQAALDRSIDRKVRIILAMRKDYTRLLRVVAQDPLNQADHQQAKDLNTLLGLDLPFEDTRDETLVEAAKAADQCANVDENKESGS